MSHYAALGVPKTADKAAIKRAFRRKAAKAHPDKGGNAAEMAALNRAYEVLSDPQRRLTYDQTGQDQQGPSIDSQVRELVLQAFMQTLQGDGRANYVDAAKGILRGKLGGVLGDVAKIKATQSELKKRRTKVKCKGGENVFHMLIDQQLSHGDNLLRNAEQQKSVVERALKLLEDYEGEAEQMVQYFTFSQPGNTSTSW